jgi:hypothetical protein
MNLPLFILLIFFAAGVIYPCRSVAVRTAVASSNAQVDKSQTILTAEGPSLPLATWSPEQFDKFTRVGIGHTSKLRLNLIGNRLFGGHFIFMVSNRRDGQEFRVDTQSAAIVDSNFAPRHQKHRHSPDDARFLVIRRLLSVRSTKGHTRDVFRRTGWYGF